MARMGLEYEVLTKKHGELYYGEVCLGSKPSEMRAALAENPQRTHSKVTISKASRLF